MLRLQRLSIADLDQLLRAVIQVNPYLVGHLTVGEKWGEVAQVVQDAGYCKGRDVSTLKNKVQKLLSWVEVRFILIPLLYSPLI